MKEKYLPIFSEQEGRCFLCKCDMVAIPAGRGTHWPPNMAVSYKPKDSSGFEKVVIICFRCKNNICKKRRNQLKAIFHQQKGRCYYCNRMMVLDHGYESRGFPRQATRDHKIPRSRGGSDDDSNIVAACYECNYTKGSMTESEFQQRVKSNERVC